MIEKQKKSVNAENQRIFFINLNLLNGLGLEFTAC